jgi:spore coat polysaccharide biosynthesis protein SpsF
MRSTRLPGKILADLGGEPMLTRVVERVRRMELVNEIVVATSDGSADDVIEHACAGLEVGVFRGSEDDALDRYYQAATAHQADAVVRVTADCPLIDPEVSDRVIRVFLTRRPDYASNFIERTYPRGLDTEVVAWPVLARVWREAASADQRVHVTSYITENPDRFHVASVTCETDHSDHRWTVDTQRDLEFMRAVYARLADKDRFGWGEVLALLAREPYLGELNRHVRQKALVEG